MKYIGKGKFIAGIPAKDLTDEQVRLYGKARLLKTGLYEEERKCRREEKALESEGEE